MMGRAEGKGKDSAGGWEGLPESSGHFFRTDKPLGLEWEANRNLNVREKAPGNPLALQNSPETWQPGLTSGLSL